MEIRKITAEDLTIFLDFFDNRGFTDNPDWAFCYCNCFYADHCEKRWVDRIANENREATKRRIEAGEMNGFLAIENDSMVGWCGAGPMNSIPQFKNDLGEESSQTGVITCFLVDPNKRRRGIARALLRKACRSLANDGLRIIEANPRPHAKSQSELHFGPLSLYESEGFKFHREDPEDGSVYLRKIIRY